MGVAVSYRTTIIGALAGLTFAVAALQGNGPMTSRDWALLVAGALLAALGAVARDAASTVPPPPALPPSRPSDPPPPVTS